MERISRKVVCVRSFIGSSNCLDLNGLIHHFSYTACHWWECGKGSSDGERRTLSPLFLNQVHQRLQSVFVITWVVRNGGRESKFTSLPLLIELIAALGMVVHVMFLNHVWLILKEASLASCRPCVATNGRPHTSSSYSLSLFITTFGWTKRDSRLRGIDRQPICGDRGLLGEALDYRSSRAPKPSQLSNGAGGLQGVAYRIVVTQELGEATRFSFSIR